MAIDYKKLVKRVNEKADNQTLMKEFGFKTSTQVRSAYLNALIAENIVQPITGGRKGKKEASKVVTIKKNGGLSISPKILESLAFKAGDKFIVKKNTKGGITLSKIKPVDKD